MDKLQPVAWIIESDEEFKNGKNYPTLDWYVKDILNLPIGTKLYTHPVKELTDDDILKLAKKSGFVLYKNNIDWSSNYDKEIKQFARAILKRASEK